MNFKELYVSQNISNILQAKKNILREIDNKIDILNNYIIGRSNDNVDYPDVETAKQHFDNLVELRKSVDINDDKFIELDFDELNIKLKEERVRVDKGCLFTGYYTCGIVGGTIACNTIANSSISSSKLATRADVSYI